MNCPTCNRSSAEARFYGSFCEFCAREKLDKKLNDTVEITICKRCGRIKKGSRFAGFSERTLEELLASKFSKYSLHLIKNTGTTASVEIGEYDHNGLLTTQREITIKYQKTLCDICYKKASDYYEAVFQLRGNQTRFSKFIRHLERYLDINNGFIAKIVDDDNGLDVYVSDKKIAAEFVGKLKIHPTMSYTLAGVKSGKKFYKHTFALHFE